MRRNALMPMAVLAVFCGCNKPKANVEANVQIPETAPEPELFAVDPAESATMPEAGSSTSTYSPYSPAATGGANGVTVESNTASFGGDDVAGGPTTHKVARGDTLYALARKYYNDPKRWKTIYEANRDKIPSPKSLPVDKTLVIP